MVEGELETQQIQINSVAEVVDSHDSDIHSLNENVTSLAENDVTQDVRLDSVEEDDMDEWDDKITALEVANVDITVEEILLGNTYNLGYARSGEFLYRAGFHTSIVMIWDK